METIKLNDPIEPFRAEYKALQCGFQKVAKGCFLQGYKSAFLNNGYNPSLGPAEVLSIKRQMDRAFRAWKIAEREGPNAALLWKLSN